MLPTVQFNNEVRFKADEIDDVPPNRRLPAEFVTTQAVGAEMLPQDAFGVGGIGAEVSGVGRGHVGWWIETFRIVLSLPLSLALSHKGRGDDGREAD